MKKSAVLLAFLAQAVSVWAVPVTVDQAKLAARAWASRGGTLGSRVGTTVKAAHEFEASGDKVYAISMNGGGAVFLTSDTTLRPVIAFTSATNDFAAIDEKSPLWALLAGDAAARVKMSQSLAASGTSSAATAAAASRTSDAEATWAALLEEGAKLDDASFARPLNEHIKSPGDLRAGPLVQSQWDQKGVNGQDCYNYYTPVLSDGTHAVCGCVATAMSQIMRYHEFPTEARAQVTRDCYVEISKASTLADATRSLTTQGGTYSWNDMPLVPESADMTEAQRQAIGKLTSDAGISVYMSYDTDSSGAFSFNVARALKNVFGYANAAYMRDSTLAEDAAKMRKVVFSNLDAGYPVLFGISGDGGHAVVGDGYGFNDGKTYVHLNMGWAGQDDVWYNLPDIDTTYYAFSAVDDVVFNIFPDSTGDATLAGRALDDDGAAIAGASVTVYQTGTETIVASGTTSENGVYGLLVPAGTYDVRVVREGSPAEELTAVSVPETKTVSTFRSGWLNKDKGWYKDYSCDLVTSAGNSWGNDVEITEPCASITVDGVTTVYSSLDKAVAAARTAQQAGGLESVTIEILTNITLNATATIDFPCVLTTADGAKASAPVVTRGGKAAFEVVDGGSLELKDVTFAKGASTVVTVSEGGVLRLGSGVYFSIPATVAAVQTAEVSGFVMIDALSSGFSFECLLAKDAGCTFGSSTLSADDASSSTALIANIHDTYGEQRGAAKTNDAGETILYWLEQEVPFSESAGYFVDKDGVTNTAARLDRVFEKYVAQRDNGQIADTSEIVVCNRMDLEFTKRIEVNGDLTVRGAAGTSLVTLSSWGKSQDVGFDVGAGATLTIRDLALTNYVGEAFLRVTGGTLNVGGVTRFEGFQGTNVYSGVIAVLSGRATLGADADGYVLIYDCSTLGQGAALYLKDGGCSASLRNQVEISGCSARNGGGGIYVGYEKKGGYATLGLSGYLYVDDNYTNPDASTWQLNNIAVARPTGSTAQPSLVLEGLVELGSHVGLIGARSGADDFSTNGYTFMRVADDFTNQQQIYRSCYRLYSDVNPATLEAEPSSDYSTIAWTEDDGSVNEVSPGYAFAHVIFSDKTEKWYGSVEDAFVALGDSDGTVELLADDVFATDITVKANVTLTSGGVYGPYTLSRRAQCQVNVGEGASLVVTNVTVSGAFAGSWWDEAGGEGTLFNVEKGALTLANGAILRDVTSNPTNAVRAGSAVKVYNGTFTMLDGSQIADCQNVYADNNRGGAVTADSKSVVRLLGGTVTGCLSARGGGVYVGNETTVEVGGAFTASDNVSSGGPANNVYVAATSELLLVSPFTGKVGYTPGPTADTNVFGRVSADFEGTDAELADSAHNFTHDQTGDVGIAVKPSEGAGDTLLVWSDALDASGSIDVNGTNYVMVAGGETLSASVTSLETILVYNGRAQTPTIEGHGFVVECEPQTNAGTYVATVTPKAGFEWADGTAEAVKSGTVSWKIAKAKYDMSNVKFSDGTFLYDGSPKYIYVSGTLPTGVTVSYTDNGKTEIGTNTVVAVFTGDKDNYELIPSMTAQLMIVSELPTPTPEPEPTPSGEVVQPTPIAFQSITKVSEAEDGTTTWRLVITNRVPWCNYRLISTDDLTKGFTTTGAWEQAPSDATPVWTTNVTTTTEKLFWRAEGKEGEVGD